MPENKPRARFLTDDAGHPSSMRLMSMFALFGALAFGWSTIQTPDNMAGVYVTIGFLTAAFAPKALQKFVEMRFSGGQERQDETN